MVGSGDSDMGLKDDLQFYDWCEASRELREAKEHHDAAKTGCATSATVAALQAAVDFAQARYDRISDEIEALLG